MKLRALIENDAVRIGEGFAASFHRTLRVPESGGPYPLPPGFGVLPIVPVEAVAQRLPQAWRDDTLGIVPIRKREAVWIGLRSRPWRPCAVIVRIGRVNALTGSVEDDALHVRTPQNYMVAPPQVWLDGVKTAAGRVRQFVAVPQASRADIERQVAGPETTGGLLIAAVEAKLGRFPDEPPPEPSGPARARMPRQLGLGAGGEIRQKIYPDPHGPDTWDENRSGSARIRLIEARIFEALTGRPVPPSPIDAKSYADAGFPWFALYDEDAGDITPAEALARLAPTGASSDLPLDEAVEIDDNSIHRIGDETIPPSGRREPSPGKGRNR